MTGANDRLQLSRSASRPASEPAAHENRLGCGVTQFLVEGLVRGRWRIRPKTLAEVAALAAGGDSFDRCLANFLDEFYRSPNAHALADEPQLLRPRFGEQGQVQDAYLAATAEELCREWQLPVPEWTASADRALHRPWFASPLASLRAVLLVESPAAFRARNLFVSANALTRV